MLGLGGGSALLQTLYHVRTGCSEWMRQLIAHKEGPYPHRMSFPHFPQYHWPVCRSRPSCVCSSLTLSSTWRCYQAGPQLPPFNRCLIFKSQRIVPLTRTLYYKLGSDIPVSPSLGSASQSASQPVTLDCLGACIPHLGSYVFGTLYLWPLCCHFPASLALAGSGSPGFAGFPRHSLSFLFITTPPVSMTVGFFFFFGHVYILQTLSSPHICALFSSFHIICCSLTSMKMFISYRTNNLCIVFIIRLDSPPTAVQLLALVWCKHNFSTTDAFLQEQSFHTKEVGGGGRGL